jgi:hypothetical protein
VDTKALMGKDTFQAIFSSKQSGNNFVLLNSSSRDWCEYFCNTSFSIGSVPANMACKLFPFVNSLPE